MLVLPIDENNRLHYIIYSHCTLWLYHPYDYINHNYIVISTLWLHQQITYNSLPYILQDIIIYTFLLLVVAALCDALPLTTCRHKSWPSASKELEEQLNARRNDTLTGQVVGSDCTDHNSAVTHETALSHAHSHPAHSLCAWTYHMVTDDLRFPKVTVEARLSTRHSTCSQTSRECTPVHHTSPFLVPINRETPNAREECVYELKNLPITVGWVCAKTD